MKLRRFARFYFRFEGCSSGWSSVVDFGFKYLTPLSSSYPIDLSSLSVEGCKKITEGKKERDEDTFQLKLYFGVS